ncbi:MAG: nucleotidyltransferase domain-containing protein [Planctomycetota bacterium]|nr:MAG: nucleotidyltransferase domain-containing protein [Planctomycetota bacterium]
MSTEMEQRIQASLSEIEATEGVKILFACESGSRAWGFASQDSDYDVRFLYLHPPEWYLSINLEAKRDVIERPIVDELDVNGWDLRKALKLFRKSNPPLLEWLGSPIVYREPAQTAAKMRKLADRV